MCEQQVTKMKNVDKGFELIYFNLSHRRKFIRTIWITIVGVFILLPVMFYLSKKYVPSFPVSHLVFFLMEAVVLIIGLIQAVYEYRKWKSEKTE